MALNIKDPITERLVRELAAMTGESITIAIRKAAQERLERVSCGEPEQLVTELVAIGQRCAALPVLNDRSADKILGYDKNGLPC